ncbi:MAG: hypothetical protein QM479_09970 [Pseudomonadota bacterium]
MKKIELMKHLLCYPNNGWDVSLVMNHYTKESFIAALSDILKKYGKFPVVWEEFKTQEGLLVVGHGDSYIGHWNSIEKIDECESISIASEDIGNIEDAAEVIFRSLFSACVCS